MLSGLLCNFYIVFYKRLIRLVYSRPIMIELVQLWSCMLMSIMLHITWYCVCVRESVCVRVCVCVSVSVFLNCKWHYCLFVTGCENNTAVIMVTPTMAFTFLRQPTNSEISKGMKSTWLPAQSLFLTWKACYLCMCIRSSIVSLNFVPLFCVFSKFSFRHI